MNAAVSWDAATVSERLDAALEKAKSDPAAAHVYIKLLETRSRQQVANAAENGGPLQGALVSVKALFDVAGEVTTSATTVLKNDPQAKEDAPAIARLDAAGSRHGRKRRRTGSAQSKAQGAYNHRPSPLYHWQTGVPARTRTSKGYRAARTAAGP